MLDVYELMNLEDELRPELEEKLGFILSRLNREDRLEAFLELIGLKIPYLSSVREKCRRPYQSPVLRTI